MSCLLFEIIMKKNIAIDRHKHLICHEPLLIPFYCIYQIIEVIRSRMLRAPGYSGVDYMYRKSRLFATSKHLISIPERDGCDIYFKNIKIQFFIDNKFWNT
jgi:hypothetical protein